MPGTHQPCVDSPSAAPNKSVETEATTTVAAGWQIPTFNFLNQATGTAA